jgi:3'(2'), 5'-bisphosphate nucleotidase
MPEPDDHVLARAVAVEVGRLLVEVREAGATSFPEWLRAEGDRRSHDLAVAMLTEARPDDAVLSEEGLDHPARLGADRLWVVDPLDGTREFGERGRRDWAVHIALVEGGVPTAGAVALPAEGLVFATDLPPIVPPQGERPLRVATSRSRFPSASYWVADALGAELVPIGSAGAKAMAVVRGFVDAYVHTGGMYEWDSAAPVAVAASAGLHVSRADGSPLVYNRADPWLPDLLICRRELAPACLDAIGGTTTGWW